VKLTTHLLLVSRLIMRGAIRLLPHTSSWHSVSLNTGTTYLLSSADFIAEQHAMRSDVL
jgi:hypothetical protein